MSRTIVIPTTDEQGKKVINSFNMLAKGLGKTQTQLVLLAMQEFISRHWDEVANPNYKMPNENQI